MSPAEKKAQRLHLRLGTACNNRCVHCTVRDLWDLPDRDTRSCLEEMGRGRKLGCDQVVFMRGDPAIRGDIIQLVEQARELGYRHVQLQTNGRRLAYRKFLDRLISAGASYFEVSLFGDQAGLHDSIANAPGAFDQTIAGLKNLAEASAVYMVSVPVIAPNFQRLPATAGMLAELGVRSVQFNFARPVRHRGRWVLEPIVRLSMAAPFIADAISVARSRRMAAGTEAVPFCHLEADTHPGRDATEDWSRHAVSDLHARHEDMSELRRESRPHMDECTGCVFETDCPRTWAGYLELFGEDELFRMKPRRFERG